MKTVTISKKKLQEAIDRLASRAVLSEMTATDDQLDSVTELLMTVAGRIMAAKETPVDYLVMDHVEDVLTKLDYELQKWGLEPDTADISQLSEILSRKLK